jgi:hypothetical protein
VAGLPSVAARSAAAHVASPSRLAAAWPLPALAAWGAGWLAAGAGRALGLPAAPALTLAVVLVAALALKAATAWRRAFVAAGFPLSLAAASLAGALPAWAWLWPLVLLALAYPLRAWRDAPLFPTPAGALRGLANVAPMLPDSRILEAGCGLGDGLAELHREYPGARLDGVEWSWPLRLLCAWRRPEARVRRADMWSVSWSGHDLVYLFQRPESLARAVDKAAREMRPGSWLVSLEFEAPGLTAHARLPGAQGRPVWVYRLPAGATASITASPVRGPALVRRRKRPAQLPAETP